MTRRPLIPWWVAVLVSACLIVLAVDTGHLPGFPDWFWIGTYTTSATFVILWRWRLEAWMLNAAAMSLFVASFARAVTFLTFSPLDRAAGAALNTLIALMALNMTTGEKRHESC